MIFFHLLTLIAFLASFSGRAQGQDYSQNPSVYATTSLGRVRGVHITTAKGNEINAFLGIPYAESTAGPNRFLPPVPRTEPWALNWDGSKFGKSCPIIGDDPDNTDADEDCLNINVMQGIECSADKNSKCPVVVYLFAGGHVLGASSVYIPEDWADYLQVKDIVVAVVEFRVMSFGFWTTGDDVAPGNAITWDQIAALKWVQKEIAGFGGDPDNVSVMGTSSGGMDVNALALSPLTQGLIHKGIQLSGSTLLPGYLSDNTASCRALAVQLGCATQAEWDSGANSKGILKCMQALSMADILRATYNVSAQGSSFTNGRLDGAGGIFPEDTISLAAKRRPLPYYLGTVQKEMLVTGAIFPNATQAYVGAACAVAAQLFQLRPTFSLILGCMNLYQRTGLTPGEQIGQMLGDVTFFLPTLRDAITLEAQGAPVYLYQFDYTKPEDPYFPEHADDTCYNVGGATTRGLCDFLNETTDADNKVRALNTGYIRNFIKSGNPTPGGAWQKFNPNFGNYYSIQASPQNKYFFHKSSYDFWINRANGLRDSSYYVTPSDIPVDAIEKIFREPLKAFVNFGTSQSSVEKNQINSTSPVKIIVVGAVGILALASIVAAVVITKRRQRKDYQRL